MNAKATLLSLAGDHVEPALECLPFNTAWEDRVVYLGDGRYARAPTCTCPGRVTFPPRLVCPKEGGGLRICADGEQPPPPYTTQPPRRLCSMEGGGLRVCEEGEESVSRVTDPSVATPDDPEAATLGTTPSTPDVSDLVGLSEMQSEVRSTVGSCF